MESAGECRFVKVVAEETKVRSRGAHRAEFVVSAVLTKKLSPAISLEGFWELHVNMTVHD